MHTSPPLAADLNRALFDETADALFLCDPDTDQLLDVNPASLRLTGSTRQDLLRRPTSYWLRGEGRGGAERLREASQKSVLFHSREGYFLRTCREGVWLPVNLSVSRLHLRPKTLALITARDISEQRETALRLKQAEGELSRLTASIDACLWSAEVSAAGRWEYRYWSHFVETITGRPPAFFLPGTDRWEEVVHPEDRATWQAGLARCQAGASGQEEYRVVRPDGVVRWARESIRATRADDGRAVRLDAVITDITERRAAETALREQQTILQNVIAHIPDAVFWKDRRSAYLGCNERCAQNLGTNAPAGLIGKTDREIHRSAEEADFYMACDRQVIETGQPMLDIEETQVRPDGQQAVLLTSKVPLRDAAGVVVGVLGIYRDITDRKRLEEQLRQAQKMEAIGRLAGGIAHDFNNLLTAILGHANLLLSDLGPHDPIRQGLEEINKAGERAAALTHQLLAYSRKQILAPKVLDLNAVVANLGPMLRRLIGEDIDLVTTSAPALGRVRADPGQIAQVLLNLAVNARDAMPTGGKLTLETRNVELDEAYARDHPEVRPGAYVLLAVSDTGVGMDAAARSRIFEPFFTTKGEKGTGLGMATVYGIVKQSGGHIAVYSEPGLGATFKVYLPRTQEAPTGPSLEGAAGRAAALPRGLETVLLAEDEGAVRALARQILTECGYTVLEAEHGADALRLAKRHRGPVDLLVTDVVMPGIGGRELADQLALLHSSAKVLFLSGYTDEAVVRNGVLKAEVAFLQKPFTPAALAHKVRKLLDERSDTVQPGERGV